MNKKIIEILFSDMCCSECKADFTEDSVFVLRKEKNLNVIQVICQNCGKSCKFRKDRTPYVMMMYWMRIISSAILKMIGKNISLKT